MNAKTLLAAAAVFLLPAAAFASTNIDMDTEVHDRTTLSIAGYLADQGINADRIEEWGDAIRVDAVDQNGKNYVVLVSKNDYRPLEGSVVR